MVLKAAEDSPRIALLIAQVMKDAGLPGTVLVLEIAETCVEQYHTTEGTYPSAFRQYWSEDADGDIHARSNLVHSGKYVADYSGIR